MTTIDPQVAATGVGHAADVDDLNGGLAASLGDWLTTTDHKKIGRLLIGASMGMLVAVTALGLLLGIERIDATANVIDTDSLPQLFSLYRIVLTFGVVAPFMLGLAVAVVPLQLGARAIAFPRLVATGFWTWLIGAALVIGSIIANGGPGGGDAKMVDLFLASHVVLILGLVVVAISVAASVLTTRAPGMNMRRVPLFAWSALVGSLGLVLLLPVLAGALVLLFVDHRGARTTFGGNDGISRWIQFAFTQPATFVYAVPAFGIAAEVIATATRSRMKLRGVALLGIGLLGSAAVAGVSQVSTPIRADIGNLDATAVINDVLPYALFNLLPVLGAALVLAVGLLALVTNRPKISAALLFSFFGAGLAFVGMLGNAVYLIGDAHLAGTVFEEASWVYVCYGTVLAGLGGVAYWGPKLWGRTMSEGRAIPLALLGALGTVLASLPYFIAGFAKQPADNTIFDYGGPQNLWNVLITVGHGSMVLTVVAFVALAISSFSGDLSNVAGDDPWDGQTLEWATSSPAPAGNFSDLHAIASAEPLLDLKPARLSRAASAETTQQTSEGVKV